MSRLTLACRNSYYSSITHPVRVSLKLTRDLESNELSTLRKAVFGRLESLSFL